mmetsp:Transcript_51022/g.84712  ORF Transcript_51022/g.84712 Transcript_51022/m.84712 type:complete len:303 (+) Transcript_51022:30-938(+)
MTTVADLSIIGYVFHWIMLVFLCRKPIYLLLAVTFGIYFACFCYLFTDENYVGFVEGYDWFIYAKRSSLIVGYLVYVAIYTTNSKASRVIAQWVLTINVLEAAVLALQFREIIVGVLLIAISLFSPLIFVNENDQTLMGKSGNLLQKEKYNFLSVKWYFRCHFIFLGVWYPTSVYFNERGVSLFDFLSCAIPFVLSEYRLNNFVNHFSVRTFALFIAVAIFSTFDREWLTKQPGAIISANLNIVVRNLIQTVLILVCVALAVLNDRYRETTDERNSKEETVQEQIVSNEEQVNLPLTEHAMN